MLAAISAFAAPASASMDSAPHIPEPMVFDMVRPLAARRGELEANALALFPLSAPGEKIDWAPEIEYAFADGHAAELELPFENGRLTSGKIGLQGTFGTFAADKAVHGWQFLGIVDRDTGRVESSLLYIVGVRYSPRWTSLTMVGVNIPNERHRAGERRDNALLVNHSVFRDFSPRTTAGIEFNVRAGRRDTSWLIIPQLHQRLAPDIMMQAGAGIQKPANRRAHPNAALRMIKEF